MQFVEHLPNSIWILCRHKFVRQKVKKKKKNYLSYLTPPSTVLVSLTSSDFLRLT